MSAETKKPYQSKTIQMNTVAVMVSYGLAQAGYQVPAEVQMAALAFANFILRMVTKGAVSFSE